ncbi:MAG TPA: anhydro-N-acetylmuramic acid kinase [Bdellovibrionota bacterium]|nr:anhydro-N-acetylmuramic acid kinase [Bdellovibrionota bacterium]
MVQKKKKPSGLRIVGVMTGTSCDGLDAACLEMDEAGWRPVWEASQPYPASLRERVLGLQKPGTTLELEEVLRLDRDLGEWYGAAISRILKGRGRHADVVASHGQTVAHHPAANRMGTTMQLGDPTRIARATGLTVVAAFRKGDMAAGGEGAPLLPLFHRMLAAHLDRSGRGIAIHNLGGISNLTYVAPGKNGAVLAFDTGPANIWIDAAVSMVTDGKQSYDENGRIGLKGRIDIEGVRRALRHPYFRRPIPKSTGRDDFPFEHLLSSTRVRGADLVATATAVTVESIGLAYEAWITGKRRPLGTVLLCGGGARNPLLVGWLQDRLSGIDVTPIEEVGLSSTLIEAQGFAFFGYLSLLGQPLGGPWTGAQGFGPPGQIVPGKNWPAVVEKLGR